MGICESICDSTNPKIETKQNQKQKLLQNPNASSPSPSSSSISLFNLEVLSILVKAQKKIIFLKSNAINETSKIKNEFIKLKTNSNINKYNENKIQIKNLIIKQNLISIYDILIPLFDKVKKKFFDFIQNNKNITKEIIKHTEIDTLIYVSNYLNVNELLKFKEIIKNNYGINYVKDAEDNKNRMVNKEIINKINENKNEINDLLIYDKIKELLSSEENENRSTYKSTKKTGDNFSNNNNNIDDIFSNKNKIFISNQQSIIIKNNRSISEGSINNIDDNNNDTNHLCNIINYYNNYKSNSNINENQSKDYMNKNITESNNNNNGFIEEDSMLAVIGKSRRQEFIQTRINFIEKTI